jgi:hypothetical protein
LSSANLPSSSRGVLASAALTTSSSAGSRSSSSSAAPVKTRAMSSSRATPWRSAASQSRSSRVGGVGEGVDRDLAVVLVGSTQLRCANDVLESTLGVGRERRTRDRPQADGRQRLGLERHRLGGLHGRGEPRACARNRVARRVARAIDVTVGSAEAEAAAARTTATTNPMQRRRLIHWSSSLSGLPERKCVLGALASAERRSSRVASRAPREDGPKAQRSRARAGAIRACLATCSRAVLAGGLSKRTYTDR